MKSNRMSRKNRILYMALSSIISALSVVLMILTNIITILSVTLPAVAGVLTAFLVIETDKKYALMSFVCVSVLSFLFVADKSSVLFYLLFFGYYPILKAIIEKYIKSKFILRIVKFLVFSICIVLSYFILVNIFMFSKEESIFNGISLLLPVYYMVVMITLIAYDIAITQLIIRYIVKFKPYVDNILKNYKQ